MRCVKTEAASGCLEWKRGVGTSGLPTGPFALGRGRKAHAVSRDRMGTMVGRGTEPISRKSLMGKLTMFLLQTHAAPRAAQTTLRLVA